jgi:hypothetical protein
MEAGGDLGVGRQGDPHAALSPYRTVALPDAGV